MNLRSADATEVFRRLYYHLYSNSSTSRADRIIEDLSRLLLGKLAVEELGQPDLIDGIIAGSSDPDAVLIPLLARRFPAIVQPDDAFSLDASLPRTFLETPSRPSWALACVAREGNSSPRAAWSGASSTC
jgi:hypothetical protein